VQDLNQNQIKNNIKMEKVTTVITGVLGLVTIQNIDKVNEAILQSQTNYASIDINAQNLFELALKVIVGIITIYKLIKPPKPPIPPLGKTPTV